MILGQGIRSVLKNGTILAGSNWIEIALVLVYGIAIARVLGDEGYGLWSYAQAACGLAVSIASFRFEQLVAIRLGADRNGTGRYLGVSLVVRLALLCLMAACLVAYAIGAESQEIVRNALLFAVPAVFGRSLSSWSRSVFTGRQCVGRYISLTSFMRVLEVICGLALLNAGAGILVLLIVHSVSWILQGVIGVIWINRRLIRIHLLFDRDDIGELLQQGCMLGLSTILTAWMLSGPILLVRHLIGDLGLVGQVGVALQVTAIIVASGQPFFFAALPLVSRSVARQDKRVENYGRLTALLSLGLTVLGALAGYVLGRPLAVLVLGPDFALAGDLIAPAVIVAGLTLMPTGFAHYLIANGLRWPSVLASAAGAILLIALTPAAVSILGAYGVFVAAGGAWLIRAAILIYFAQRISRQRSGLIQAKAAGSN